jgi:hypothetical protein
MSVRYMRVRYMRVRFVGGAVVNARAAGGGWPV